MKSLDKSLLSLLMTGTVLSAPTIAAAQDGTSVPEDVVVTTGVFIPNEKRITSEITSVLDEKVFSQIGASDIASALTRVTGLSLNQGKFVIVRGLNERYSSATLNGGPLPSPEPLRRVAPLDLFPTSVLSDAVVSKTFSPEMSGEFGGGAVDLQTRGVPDEAFFEISIDGEANTETSLREGLVYEGSDTDFLGFDDGLRDLPPLDANGNPTENFNLTDTAIIDRQKNIPFDGGFRLSGGNSWDLDGGQRIGFLATAGYGNDWETRRGIARPDTRISGDDLEARVDLARQSTEQSIEANGLLSLGVEFDPDNTVELVGLATRQTSKEARIDQGFNEDDDLIRRDVTQFIEREVYMGQLLGEHFIPGLNDAEFNWRASYSIANRDAPYETEVAYINDPNDNVDGFVLDLQRGTETAQLQFSDLEDETVDFGGDLIVPLAVGARDVELGLGGSYSDKQRKAEVLGFFYSFNDLGLVTELVAENAAGLTPRIDSLLSDTFFATPINLAGETLFDIGRVGTVGEPDASDTGLEVYAAYASLDTEITPDLRMSGGLRFESSEQTTIVSDLVSGETVEFAPLEEDFFLPAVTATYTFAENWQLRLAASRTINRPQFRELAPTRFVNTDTEELFIGNPFLTNSKATNFDARLEYYFASDQFITVGGFYKDLTDPIEEFVRPEGDGRSTSFINAPSAELYGIELEFEKNFYLPDDFGPMSDLLGGQRFVIRSNYTYADSKVSAGSGNLIPVIDFASADLASNAVPSLRAAEGFFRDGRRLQGQSDHLANLQLGIEHDSGWDAFVLLNYTSDRIRAVEDLTNGQPAIIEELPLSLDIVINVPFELAGGEYELGLRAQNVLGDDYKASQNLGGQELIVDQYDLGTSFKASLKRRF